MPQRFKNALFTYFRRLDLLKKYEDLANFVRNVEIDRSPVPRSPRRVVVLSPHPDDESLGCGGTIRHFVQQGTEVTVLYLTGGEHGLPYGENWDENKGKALREIRVKEAQAACQTLGVKEVVFLGGNDTQLHHQLDLSLALAGHLSANAYDLIFCPWPFDSHSDHAATFRIFQRAAKTNLPQFQAWLYEVWNPVLANRFVNIDSTMATKLQAISEHRSQAKVLDFKGKIVALSQYRSLSVPGAQHAEAFFVCDSEFIRSFRI